MNLESLFKEIAILADLLGFITKCTTGNYGRDVECRHPCHELISYTIYQANHHWLRIMTVDGLDMYIPLKYSNPKRILTHARLFLLKTNKELNNENA